MPGTTTRARSQPGETSTWQIANRLAEVRIASHGWFVADDSGWCWVPGREWAPSWVSWRHGDGLVGWAPLPPWAGWQSTGVARDVWIEPRYYNFVEERHLVEPRIRSYYVPFERVQPHYRDLRDVTNYERSGHSIQARPSRPRRSNGSSGDP